MTNLRVPTLRLPVTITCINGRTFAGHVFLPSQSSRHAGPMHPEEWSEGVHTFFPFRAHDAANSTVFNLESVVAFSVSLDALPVLDGADDDAPMAHVPVFRVTVDAQGANFEGNVTIDMPPDCQRVADWLNAPGAFFSVRAERALHLIQKRHVTSVVELDRIAA